MTFTESSDQPAEALTGGWPRTWMRGIIDDFGIKPDLRTGNYIAELKTLVGVYLVVLGVCLLFMRGYFLSTDHVAVYQVTRSLVEDHDLAIDPINNAVLGPDGGYYSVFGVGQSILSIPFYLAGKWVEQFSPPALAAYWSGRIVDIWGGTVPIFFVSTFNQFAVPLICVVVYLFGRQLGFGRGPALATSLILAFGTLAFSQSSDYFQHPLESALLLLAIYILFANQNRLRERHAWLAGIFLGFGILTRINLLFLYPVLGFYFWVLFTKTNHPVNGQTRFAYLQSFSLPVVLALVITLYLNQIRFGNPLTFNPVFSEFGLVDPIFTGVYGYLFSLGRSIFLYSPPLLMAVISWPRFQKHHKNEARLFMMILLVFLATYSFSANWAGGWSWGPRYLLAIVPLFILPLGYGWEAKKKALLVIILAILGTVIQLLGMIINYSYVHTDWVNMGFTNPSQEYIFIPRVSPIVMHLRSLALQGYIDTWLSRVYQQYGLWVLLGSLIIPLVLLFVGISLLKQSNVRSEDDLIESL